MKHELPKISIIIPVYDAAKYLDKCLNSVLNQTLKEIEILCVNDGSKDDSLDILREYEKKDSRIKVFTQENSGPARARNIGLENATGKYIMFCDSDDWYEPTMCEKMHRSMEKENVDLVMCNANTIGKDYNKYAFPFRAGKYNVDDNIKIKINVWLWNKIFKKSIIDDYKISFPDGHKCDDNLFIFEYFAVAKHILFIDKKLYNYVLNEFSVMEIYRSDKVVLNDILAHVNILNLFYDFLTENKILESNLSAFYCLCENEISWAFLKIGIHWQGLFFDRIKLLIKKLNIKDCEYDALKAFFENINSSNYIIASKILSLICKRNCGSNATRKLYLGQELPIPAFKKNNIPVVFASDNNYAKYLSVSIASLMKNSNSRNNYDIIVLTENISEENQELLLSIIQDYHNISIRFFYMNAIINSNSCDNLFTNGYIKLPTYYRLFIGSIFKNYDKLIYLDSDLVINADIADLLQTDIQGKTVGAVVDFPITSSHKIDSEYWNNLYKYITDILDIKNINEYFNAGVLLIDLTKIITNAYEEQFIECAKSSNKMFHDQDVLNSILKNDKFLIDPSWNYQRNNHSQFVLNYSTDKKNIIHYSGNIKPWIDPSLPKSDIWWHYARMTPFYEEMLYKNIKQQSTINQNQLKNVINYNKNRLKYWRYKILSKITFGKRRKSYKEKRKIFKEKRDQARKFLKN